MTPFQRLFFQRPAAAVEPAPAARDPAFNRAAAEPAAPARRAAPQRPGPAAPARLMSEEAADGLQALMDQFAPTPPAGRRAAARAKRRGEWWKDFGYETEDDFSRAAHEDWQKELPEAEREPYEVVRERTKKIEREELEAFFRRL